MIEVRSSEDLVRGQNGFGFAEGLLHRVSPFKFGVAFEHVGEWGEDSGAVLDE